MPSRCISRSTFRCISRGISRCISRRPPDTERSRLFWAGYALVYDSLWDNPLLQSAGAVIARLPATDSTVREVGAGTGVVTRHLVAAGHRVEAVEPDPAMARRLTRRLPQVPVRRCTVDDLGSARPAEAVIAVNVIHLLPDPLAAIDRLRRGCVTGGAVIVVTPDPGAGLAAVAIALHRARMTGWWITRFIALHLLLGPFAAFCGIKPGAALCWADSDQLRAYARSWPPTAGPVSTIFRLLVLPGTAPPSDPADRDGQSDPVIR
jgi:SAM-dependent methyltransferase